MPGIQPASRQSNPANQPSQPRGQPVGWRARQLHSIPALQAFRLRSVYVPLRNAAILARRQLASRTSARQQRRNQRHKRVERNENNVHSTAVWEFTLACTSVHVFIHVQTNHGRLHTSPTCALLREPVVQQRRRQLNHQMARQETCMTIKRHCLTDNRFVP